MRPFTGTYRRLAALTGACVLLVASHTSSLPAAEATKPRAGRIRAIIRAELPAYDPRLYQPSKPTPTDVVELEPFEIIESGPTDSFETAKAKDERLRRETLRRFPGSLAPGQTLSDQTTSNYGAVQVRDEQRQGEIDQLSHFTDVLAQTERKADAKAYKREWQQALIRGHDWRTEGMDRTVNGWRN